MSALLRFPSVLRPGVWVMQRLPMGFKLLVMAAVLLVQIGRAHV